MGVLSNEAIQGIVEGLHAGKTYTELARQYDVVPASIHRIAKQKGIKVTGKQRKMQIPIGLLDEWDEVTGELREYIKRNKKKD